MSSTSLPSVSSPDFLQRVKSLIELREGQTRDSSGRFVTMADLESIGVTEQNIANGDRLINLVSGDSTPPYAPTGLLIENSVINHTLSWSNPSNDDLSHIEVWRSEDNQARSLASLVAIVTAPTAKVMLSGVSPRHNYYYWIRAIDFAGNYSPWCPSDQMGGEIVAGKFAESINALLAQLTDDARYNQTYTIVADSFRIIEPSVGLTEGKKVFTTGNINGQSTVGINGDLVVDGSILTRMLSAECVDADKISANAVTADKIAANAITSEKIVAGSITGDKLTANSITTDKLAANSITSDKIVSGAIQATDIAAGAITATHLSVGCVTADAISSMAIRTQHLQSGLIISDKIATNAIMAQHLQANSVTAGAIAAASIQAGHIQAGAVTANAIAAGAITANSLAAGTITADHIRSGDISTIAHGRGGSSAYASFNANYTGNVVIIGNVACPDVTEVSLYLDGRFLVMQRPDAGTTAMVTWASYVSPGYHSVSISCNKSTAHDAMIIAICLYR